ncbi:hypothetical protein JYJ95_37870 [Corallococcus exiguus]|uniref:hypothetical protein n=1 Tax=Corallococcus exiguus TaxID=83462 RepID=UPI001A8F579B|nr:hypothetical protein [Corallococcus exiguus]MBN8472305.1 hypothetical protein [Corallococcus exiguus]
MSWGRAGAKAFGANSPAKSRTHAAKTDRYLRAASGTVSEGICGQRSLGRLSEALHEKEGAPSLVLVPTGSRTALAPVVDLELRVRTSSSPDDFQQMAPAQMVAVPAQAAPHV